jgi:hypothetical protein
LAVPNHTTTPIRIAILMMELEGKLSNGIMLSNNGTLVELTIQVDRVNGIVVL